jgi:hypothetical protein
MEGSRQFTGEDEKLALDAALPAGPSGTNESDRKLEIAVIFTSAEATIAAINQAATLMRGLNGHISLVVANTVPYPLPLENPLVSLDFNKQCLLEIAQASPVETTVHLYLCRCRLEVLTSVLKPGSLVVIGSRKGWWPTWEGRLARKLQSVGHKIILIETVSRRPLAILIKPQAGKNRRVILDQAGS